MKKGKPRQPPVLEGLAVPTSGDTITGERCDYCRRPASRLANIGKGEDRKRLCPDCTLKAIKRKCRRQ